ncbi:MAG: TadE/TadG family type IV pilus assembly protein [Actinomycetota bacterium]|nr:pilus assembly protein [Actinomycetota bacterium]
MRDSGQSTVEFALVLPLVMMVLLGLMQGGLLLRDQMVLSSAARDAAREAAVTADQSRIIDAAHRSAPGMAMTVAIDRGPKRGDPVRVELGSRPTVVPLVGAIVSGMKIKASAVMRVERAEGD